jgi:hypothetical protein
MLRAIRGNGNLVSARPNQSCVKGRLSDFNWLRGHVRYRRSSGHPVVVDLEKRRSTDI